jgi:hypothetical protein
MTSTPLSLRGSNERAAHRGEQAAKRRKIRIPKPGSPNQRPNEEVGARRPLAVSQRCRVSLAAKPRAGGSRTHPLHLVIRIWDLTRGFWFRNSDVASSRLAALQLFKSEVNWGSRIRPGRRTRRRRQWQRRGTRRPRRPAAPAAAGCGRRRREAWRARRCRAIR